MEKLLDDPMLKAARDAVATIRALFFLATPVFIGNGFLAFLIGKHANSRRALEGVAFVIASLMACGILAIWYYIRNVHDPASYEIEELVGILAIEPIGSHYRYVMERRETIRATRNNLRLIEHRTHWTGEGLKGLCEAKSLVADHQLFVGRRPEDDGRRQLWIYLGEPLGKGETAEIHIREIYEDDLMSMRPYHRKGCGRYRARNLTVVTRFAASEDPRDVEGLVWNNDRKSWERSTVGTIAFSRTPQSGSGTVEYVVNVPRPKRRHSYGIRWKSANG
jgi:hypothetical protein